MPRVLTGEVVFSPPQRCPADESCCAAAINRPCHTFM
jgi:hypothetical protein